jgi:hypothetical protein
MTEKGAERTFSMSYVKKKMKFGESKKANTRSLSQSKIDRKLHKALTYKEFRAVSGVFGTIDPPPPSPPSECPPPAPKAEGYTLAER